MRPLKLKLQGLRSYREEQEVDFEDKRLVAIVGDTGAGKSSLLEAITVALYGTSTWDAREIKSLISDGAQTMQVALTFRADGKVWRVERAISRGTYPPARHALECIDTAEKIDKKEPVDAKIRHLVGLDYEAFLRAVVLPQGRFAALLQAKPAERASILKGILRIDLLDQVREEARDAKDRMGPVVDGLRERRSKLLPDPAAAEADARERLSLATAQRDAAKTARGKIEAAREKGRSAEGRKKTLEALVSRAAEGRTEGAESVFRTLAERDAEIGGQLAKNAAELAQKQGEEEELSATIEEAEKRGDGPESLARAQHGLTTLADELPVLAADSAALEKDEAVLAKETADLERVEKMMGDILGSAEEARRIREERFGDVQRAQETLESARRLLKDLRTAQSEEAKAWKKAEKARADLDKASSDMESALAEGKKARAKLDEAEKASLATAQKHAAHAAAEGAKPGEPCPVCERPLPADFAPPRPPAMDAAQKKLDKAKKDHEAAREKYTAVRAKLDAAGEKGAEAEADLKERSSHVVAARQALSAVVSGANPDLEDAAILAGATARHADATKALAAADDRVQLTRDAVTKGKAQLDAEKKRIRERRDAVKKAKDALGARAKRLDDVANKLPPDLRPKGSAPADIAALLARVELRKLKIERVVKELSEVRVARRALEIEKGRWDERRQTEVVKKQGDLDVRLATSGERLSLLASSLGVDPPPPRPEEASLSDLAEWALDFEGAAAALIETGEASIEAAKRDVIASEEAIRSTLVEAGADTESALDAALLRAEGLHASASADLARAVAEKPLAEALDARIERTTGLVAALSEVVRLVTDGKLIQHVVQRRQRVLLAVASELLGSMTRNRYGFSEDFDVVDRLSGQARGTRTLSGGETFLASLSLSLALVELAGRAGGRLEALFLDEGFGSLDAGSLSEALDALTAKAEGGRLVAVISHLKSVAETIDKVLTVRMTATGSKATWLSSEDREKMLAEDVERGLLT